MGAVNAFTTRKLPSTTLPLVFLLLLRLVNASFTRLKIWRHARGEAKYGVLSMELFTSIGRCEPFYDEELPLATLHFFCFCHFLVNVSLSRLKISRHARGDAKYGVLSLELLTSISVLIYLTFLAFHPLFAWCGKGLGSINFLLHHSNWFHRWLFNIIYVQYGFVITISFLLCLA